MINSLPRRHFISDQGRLFFSLMSPTLTSEGFRKGATCLWFGCTLHSGTPFSVDCRGLAMEAWKKGALP